MSQRFDLPIDVIFFVSEAVIRLDSAPHPLTVSRAAIEANWKFEVARKPALFNGEVALLSSLVRRGHRLEGVCHIVDYATFLFWRSSRPNSEAGHAYAHAMLVTNDNALVAVRMAPQTLNGGLVYFAAGSFEPLDFRGGVADIESNMHREVAEETGLDLSAIPREAGYHVLRKTTGTVLFKRYFLPFEAHEAERRIREHVKAQADSEIEDAVIIRDADVLPENLAPQMEALIDWHFGTSDGQ